MLLILLIAPLLGILLYFLLNNNKELPEDKPESNPTINQPAETLQKEVPGDKPEPIQNNESLEKASYKEDFLYKGLNSISTLIDHKELDDEEWKDFIKNDPQGIFNEDLAQESEKGLMIKNLFFRDYKISVTKFIYNRAYSDFYLKEQYFPGQRIPPIESLHDLISNATRQEVHAFVLTSPSFSSLIQGKDLIKKYGSGYFNRISPKIKTFYFPIYALQAIPDVILWYYSESDLDPILNVTGGNIEDILDDEGYVKFSYWPILIDNYLSETDEPLENIRSWEH